MGQGPTGPPLALLSTEKYLPRAGDGLVGLARKGRGGGKATVSPVLAMYWMKSLWGASPSCSVLSLAARCRWKWCRLGEPVQRTAHQPACASPSPGPWAAQSRRGRRGQEVPRWPPSRARAEVRTGRWEAGAVGGRGTRWRLLRGERKGRLHPHPQGGPWSSSGGKAWGRGDRDPANRLWALVRPRLTPPSGIVGSMSSPSPLPAHAPARTRSSFPCSTS